MQIRKEILYLAVVAFLFKCWNERQMTYSYQRQAVAQERQAVALELITMFLPTVRLK